MHRGAAKKIVAVVIVVTAITCAILLARYAFLLRDVPQPDSITATQRDAFLYGSVGAEKDAGIPYWIWLVLPRIFPEYLPGTGGYASLGFSWEEMREMPAGFSKKQAGYVRVAGNCATCHASSVPNGADAAPQVIAAGPGHVVEVQRLLAFYKQCAQDPRFDAADILDEISMATKLSFVDKMVYRYVLIPQTKARLLGPKPVMIDERLWQHSRSPKADETLRKQMQALRGSPEAGDKQAIVRYLDTIP